MGILDGPLRSAAQTVIGQFGKPATLRTPGGSYDPATGKVTDSPSDEAITVTVGDTTRLVELGFVEEGGVTHRDLFVEVAAAELSSDPTNDQELILDSVTHQVKGVKPVYSGEQVALWQLHVRR